MQGAGSGAGKAAVRASGCRRVSIQVLGLFLSIMLLLLWLTFLLSHYHLRIVFQVVEGGEKYAEQDLMVCGEFFFMRMRDKVVAKVN